MSTEEFDRLLRFFKVLGNDSRLKIVGLLATGERYVGELAELLDVKEPTISHHLAMMRELGLVNVRAEGNSRLYSLNSAFLEGMSKEMFSKSGLSALVDEKAALTWERKVLRTFVQHGRIRQLPAREKKLLVVLRWLADKFEPDLRFPEPVLNERLERYHPDFASLRRYMIMHGFMQRENGNYWRASSRHGTQAS
jgi:hypothetical protein